MTESPKRKSSAKQTQHRMRRGFTIVELLIVLVVIAILAGVVLVAYNGVTGSAREAALKSDLKNGAGELTRLMTKSGEYPSGDPGLSHSEDTKLAYSKTNDGFCLSAASKSNPSLEFFISDSDQISSGACPTVATSISTRGTTCAVANGQAYCWGGNYYGPIGDGTTTGRPTPVAVDTSGVLNGKTVTMIASGGNNTCAVASSQVYCWGHNGDGQLGDGTLTGRQTPVAVTTSGILTGKVVTEVAAGYRHTCALASGQAYCWGYNYYRQLGDGTQTDRWTPVAVNASGVMSGKTVTALASGDYSTCAIANGQAYCWGYNANGQIGDGTKSSRPTPVSVDTSGVLSGKTVTAITGGFGHTCAVASGQAYCWGKNDKGQLGDGTATDRSSPVAVETSGILSGKTVTAIASGRYNTCAVASGQAYCWGENDKGQLGDGTATDRSSPVAVETSGMLSGKTVTAIASGGSVTCALANSQVYCWGYNGAYGVGDGTKTNRYTPVAVKPIPTI